MRASADVVFGEGIAMIEATQVISQCSVDQEGAVEVSVTADSAATEGRRKVTSLVAAEESLLKPKSS